MGGRLTFEPPRGCQICHHQKPAASGCATCHGADDLGPYREATVSVAVRNHPPRPRRVSFDHLSHRDRACTVCHVTPVTLAPADSTLVCAACHADHHAAGRRCAACHQPSDSMAAELQSAHARPVSAHGECAACHAAGTVTRLVATRSFCLACHAPAQDHYRDRECSQCHFQRSPAELTPALRRTGGAR
jgi:hypothetical protein